jgi:hypothetical protein
VTSLHPSNSASIASPGAALARTILLLRDHIDARIPDSVVAEALTDVRVTIAADRRNADSASAQHAIVTTALLAARSGAQITLELPDGLPLLGAQAPLQGDRLAPALTDVLDDLIPGVSHGHRGGARGRRGAPDVAILIGDTPWRGRAGRILRLQSDPWAGAIESVGIGARWASFDSPFGPLGAAGLGAGEIFKTAVARLRDGAIDPVAFDMVFAPTTAAIVRLAPLGAPSPSRDLGAFDLVSGGAIIQSALFALGRIPGVTGGGRIVEPERGDLTNLNRYALLLRSRMAEFKGNDLARWAASGALGGLHLTPVVARYDAALADGLAPQTPAVLVGVDDIPSRWVVQAQRPEWLGIGATTHYSAMASYHTARLGCARCLHPVDEPGAGAIPTVAFVSHWAGLWLATMFVKARTGIPLPDVQQSVFMTSVRAESPASIWYAPVPPRDGCVLGCAA